MVNQTNKADGGKSNPVLLEMNLALALAAVNATLDYGFEKYVNPKDATEKLLKPGWRDVEMIRYEAACARHRRQRYLGEMEDLESDLPHMAHEIINLLFQLQMYLETKKGGKVPKYKTPPHVWYKDTPAGEKRDRHIYMYGDIEIPKAEYDLLQSAFVRDELLRRAARDAQIITSVCNPEPVKGHVI
jgi:hypothetical protein